MAATIKIKNGTSGAPSSLAQGELAININNGSLFFGTENSSLISSSFTFSHVTASGIIKAEHLFSTDDIEATDDIIAGGKIEASSNSSNGFYLGATQAMYADSGVFKFGNAAANAHIDGADIELDATGDIDFDAAGNDVKFSKAGTTRLTVNTLRGDITASGGITSSGAISTDGAISSSTGVTASDAFFSGHVTASNLSIEDSIVHTDDTNTKISFSSADTIDMQTGGTIRVRITDEGFNLNSGHITSSGNISGSAGTILSVPRRHLDQTSQDTNGSDAQGDIYYAPGSGAGVSTTKGLVYGLATNGNLFAVDKDTESTCTGLVTVAIGDNSLNDGMLLRGMVKLSHDPFPGGDAAIGKAVYIGDSGQLTGSIDGFASDDFIRIVGYEMESGGVIYFNPDNTFIKKA